MNQVLPIGGPGKALSARDQANMLFGIAGKEPKYFPVPVALMDGIIGIFDFLAKFFPGLTVGGRPAPPRPLAAARQAPGQC